MVEEATVYVFMGADPWVNSPDPGARHDHIDGMATAIHQKDKEAKYIPKKGIFDSPTNVQHAIIDGLNRAVTRSYKHANSGGG